ncbi:MAG: hypothetical protein U1E05_27940, partial [Patescibacteria group bacterium]|nr:hypothetical protein [Patescibacteria group bacterium]
FACWGSPTIRRGCLEDPFEVLLDQRSSRASWEVTGLTLTERIARVDRRQVRRRIIDRLRERIEQAGGAWLNTSPYPFPYRSAIGFRIDHDRYHDEDLRNALAAVDGHVGAVSHYVNGAAYEQQLQVLRQLDGYDVGSHGYLHRVYRSEAENYENLARGMDVLRRAGLTPSGVAAPGGQYTRGLAAALERLGVGHSSEIHLSYDDWPFWPAGSSVLQIPIHPVSLGLFLANVRGEGVRRAAAAQQAVRAAVDYFRQTARAKYHAGEPVFFHGSMSQRLGHYPQVLRAIFDTADSFAAVWPTTLANYAAWWRARASVQLRVESQGEQLIVHAEG